MKIDSASSASRGLLGDRYEILDELGAGTSSRVVRARQLSTGQSVAIKLLGSGERSHCPSDRELERFRRETGICAALSHTNIVRLIDAGETDDGQLFAVFEYVPGETLAQALDRDGRLGVRESVRLMAQVLDALAAAHAQGIVHRDLKPANLMLSGTGARRNALVLDFGLGGLDEGRRRREWQTLTQTREFLGTPLYAAPEQLAGQPATARSDLYAWGLVLLECLTGAHPFDEGTGAERFLTGGGQVQIPDWLQGSRLGMLLERVTTLEPEARDASAESLLRELDELAADGELPVAPEQPGRPRPLAETGERRHLTVLFCDLVDSAGLAGRLGPEHYRQVVARYHACGAEVVTRYDGHVAQYLGDGLLIYFGHPHAHEDDAERAVRAGRELLQELAALNPELETQHGVRLAARVGIHSGPVVVGEMGRGDGRQTLALGDTPTIASRLQAVAEPDTLVISDATLRLVAGIFVTEDRGTPQLKGIAEPIRVYRVLHPSGVASRLDRAVGLTPFVGREQELGLLLDRFEQMQEGRGQAVWISGEAGIGKSRLLHRLRECLRETPHTWLECRCSPFTQNSALHPTVELLEQALRFDDGAEPSQQLERLERGLALVDLDAVEVAPLLAPLLSLELPERYPALGISPQLQRQRTLEALLSWVLGLAEKQPLVLVVEDLHWSDPSTLEWLGLLIEQCGTARVLMLSSFRPEFEPPWPGRAHVLPIALTRLRSHDTRELVAAAAREAELPDAILDRIAERSDGVPLFVEELLKGVTDAADALDASTSGLAIPDTLQDSLMARLDRLGDAKQVAQVASVLGREFSYPLIESVAPLQPLALREGLGQLVAAELVYQKGLPPKATYTFKHALVQDTAYESLLQGQRSELHGRVAEALEPRIEAHGRGTEQLAQHLAKAGRAEEAVSQYRRAAELATQRFAQAEASAHLHEAIELLGTVDRSTDVQRQELELQLALGAALIGARGYDDPEVERVHEQARELCGAVGEGPELLRALIGLSLFHFVAGRLGISAELAEQALTIATRRGEVYPRLVAHTRLGITLNASGDPVRALEHLERALELHDPSEHRSEAPVWGQDWGIAARSYLAWCLWSVGYPERASRQASECVALAREGDPYSLVFALLWAGYLALWQRDREHALACAEEAIEIAKARGYPFWEGHGHILRGTTVGGDEGIAAVERNRDRDLGVGAVDVHLAWLLLDLGRTVEALASLEAALARPTEAHFVEAELRRLRGVCLQSQDAIDAAEGCFRKALDLAVAQRSKRHELRCATSLARLLHGRSHRDEARAVLAPVYASFTEGFDRPDLKEAKALLDELT